MPKANSTTHPDTRTNFDKHRYWDWAADSTKSHLPASVMVETLNVIKPDPNTGAPTPVTISNPLFSYTFKRLDYRQTYFSPGWVSLRFLNH